MQEVKRKLILLGDNVSEKTRKDMENNHSFYCLPASIGLFASKEPFVELFPKPRHEGEAKEAHKLRMGVEHAANTALLRNQDVTIIQSTGGDVSRHILHLCEMVDCLKKSGAGVVTVCMPFAALDRQDRPFEGRMVSEGAALLARLLKAAGTDRVITITPHSKAAISAYREVFGEHYTALSTIPLFAEDIKKRFGHDLENLCIGAPDGADKPLDAGQARARELTAEVFGDTSAALDAKRFEIAKEHTGVSDTQITQFKGDVAGKDCVIIDDMIDGGGTMINAATVLKSHGARSVTCYATQAILSGEALKNIMSAKYLKDEKFSYAIDHLVLTETIPEVDKKLEQFLASEKKLMAGRNVSVLSTAPLIEQHIEHQPALSGHATRIQPAAERVVGVAQR